MKNQADSCPFFENGREVCRSDLALSNVFGHDKLGHKIANAMLREEKRTVEAVAALSDEEILDIRVLGETALTRIRQRLGRGPVMIDGTEAVQALLGRIPEGPEWNHGAPVNNWEAASEAVAQADEETVRAALGRLLALHLYELQTEYPRVAYHNIKDRDVIILDGVRHLVVGQPEHRGEDGRTVYIKARPVHLPLAEAKTFSNGRYVRVELVYRQSEATRPESRHIEAMNHSVSELVRRVIDSGALPADFKIFDDYGRQTIPGIQTRTLNLLNHLFAEKFWDLRERGGTTLSDLLDVSDDDLWDIRNFGEGCMQNLKHSLAGLLERKERENELG